MPQDNTPIEPDNNQMMAQAASSNSVANPGYAPASEDYVAATPVTAPATSAAPAAPVVSDAVVMPGPEPVAVEAPAKNPGNTDIRSEIAEKIGENKNILIALSGDPSVDELSAAIGLSLYLDKIGKRATAIYSGATPNTLEFLKPEETFEPSADTLQDFVIALNKEKADHLRYKIDGDYVKVYITPYKHRLSEDDLEYSYGDYNVDLVIALDVANGIDLDAALREHGRIMHDASIINVTTGNPGKFGEIEWSDKKASSVSEMLAELLYEYGGEDPISKDEATAFLTGIVAATNRFSNPKTTPETMRLSSRLMESGANQVLVSKNITPDTENELFNTAPQGAALASESKSIVGDEAEDEKPTKEVDPTKLDIGHDSEPEKGSQEKTEVAEDSQEVSADVTKKEHTLLDDLKAAEASLSQAGAETMPDNENKTLKIENGQMKTDEEDSSPELKSSDSAPVESIASASTPAETVLTEPTPVASSAEPVLPEPVMPESTEKPSESSSAATETSNTETTTTDASVSENQTVNQPVLPEVSLPSDGGGSEGGIDDKSEKVIAPSADFDVNNVGNSETDKYGKMLEEALASSDGPVEPAGAIMSEVAPGENPAALNAPSAPVNPEINGVPEMNFMPTPGTDILPPPPTPPIADLSQGMPPADIGGTQPVVPAVPTMGPEPISSVKQSSGQDQSNDPGAFRIPGM